MTDVTAGQLHDYIVEHAEVIKGRRVCRASLASYLRSRGVKKSVLRNVRTRLVKELEAQGLVSRKHPRSIWIYVLDEV